MPIISGNPGYSEAYHRYYICKEMGWDYYTYESQPNTFLQEISLILFHENQYQDRQSQLNKAGSALRRS